MVARSCTWSGQDFAHVSGGLGGGVGWMCAGQFGANSNDCDIQVRVEGAAAASNCCDQVTLNSGDAVFCSA